jgi:hypothetical protein
MLLFRYGDMSQQVRAFKSVASRFLQRGETAKVEALATQLQFVRSSSRASFPWGWELDTPLRTEPSLGKYEVSGKGHYAGVHAQVSAIWEIGHEDDQHFRLKGNASTLIRLRDLENEEAEDLARWRLEIGGHDAPGSIFHAHVLADDDQPNPPFPKALSVPRFPAFPMTPMASVEFVLGELFQNDWIEHLRKTNTPFGMWRASQEKVLNSFLKWQQTTIASGTGTSPLMALKIERPKEDLFTA